MTNNWLTYISLNAMKSVAGYKRVGYNKHRGGVHLKVETSISRDIKIADVDARYDAQCKTVLSNKAILAPILSNVISEFKGLSYEVIADCIENDIAVGETPVNPGETSNPKIVGNNTENSVLHEGTVRFDIKFSAMLPCSMSNDDGKNTKEKIKVIINIEAQQAYHPGYEISTRGIFYASRMISSQLNTEFEIPNYDAIKKVYSVWICLAAPDSIGNAISEYSIQKRDLVSKIPDNKSSYDKISVIVIALNKKVLLKEKEKESTGKGKESLLNFLEMLNVLFSSDIGSDVKRNRLEKDFGIKMNKELGEELNIMCNVSGYVRREGIEEGIKKGKEEGRKEGIEEGRKETKRKVAENLIRRGMQDKEVSELSELDLEIVQEIRKSLNSEEVRAMNLF